MSFKARRIADFRKHLMDLAELEIKHAKVILFFILLLFI